METNKCSWWKRVYLIKEFPGDGFWRVKGAKFSKAQIVLHAESLGGGKTVSIITPTADHQYKFSRAPK